MAGSWEQQQEICSQVFLPICKLAASNEFCEAALLRGCSLTCRPHPRSPLSALPSQICPDVSSLSEAAPGGRCDSLLGLSPSCLCGPSQLNRVSPLPLQTRWPRLGLTHHRPWMLGHQSVDISFHRCQYNVNSEILGRDDDSKNKNSSLKGDEGNYY